jgi:hypothetical protein
VLLLLAACGGGGGGDDGGPGSSGNFTISTNSVTFDGDPGFATPAPAVVTGSITGVNQTVFLTVVVTNVGIANASVALTGDTTGALTIFPKSPAQLGFGTFNDTVTVRACLDQACAQQISGSPKTINVTYNVRGLTANPTVVTFNSTEGIAPAAAQVTFANNTASNWTSTISYEGATTGWLTLAPTSAATQGAQQLTFNATALSTPRTYSATVQLTAGNRTLNIPVTYNVAPNLGLSKGSVELSAVTGQTAPPVGDSVNVTAASGATTFTTSIEYGAGASNWLAATGNAAPGTVNVVPQTAALAPGLYAATVRLTPNGAGTPVTFVVLYRLAPSQLTLAPDTAMYALSAVSTPTNQFLQRTIGTGDTGAPLSWTAADNQPWLNVTAAGNSGQNAILTLVPSALELLSNGTHTATITFTYNGPSVVNQTRQLSVGMLLDLPTIDYAVPYVAYLNEQKQLVLRGSGFDQAGGAAVTFDGTPAATVQVVSDNELRVTPPASVVAGASRPLISIENALGFERSTSELVVRAKPQYGDQSFAFNVGTPAAPRMIHDPERDVLFIMRAGTIDPPAETSDTVLRFALDSAGQTAPALTFQQFLFIEDIGLSPDAKTRYVATQTHLHFVDPDDLTVETRPALALPAIIGRAGPMAVMNDGRILFPHMQVFYSPRTNNFESVSGINFTSTAVSADGSLVALQPSNGPKVVLGKYVAGANVFAFQQEERFSSPLSVDRNGTLIAHGGEVFNAADLTLYGSAGDDGYFSLLSPAGDRLYAFQFSPPSRIRIYDTSSSSATLPELPSIDDVPLGVSARGISFNGEHLFILDSTHLYIVEP